MPNWNWEDELPMPTGKSGDSRELMYRSTMLPLGSYRNADGTESPGFAWPGMITEPINALSRMAENSRLPDGRMGIPNPQNSENQQDAMTLLYSMYGGNALNPMAAIPKNALASGAVKTAAEQARPSVTVSGIHPNYEIMRDGSQVGRAYVREYPDTIQLGQLHVNPEFQRQGVATEAQRLLAGQYGKPTVPDVNLSASEFARWQKNDPAAVADYGPLYPGANSFSPQPGSDGYFASYGRGVMPGSRAASGELFSDTGRPSLMGSALAAEQSDQQSLLELLGYDPRNVF